MSQAWSNGDTAVLTMPDIAALAGVRREVVTNWRRRHPEFPPPLADGNGPARFDGQTICDWLVVTGRAQREEVDIDLHLHTLNTYDSSLPAGEVFAAVTALICLCYLDADTLTESNECDSDELGERAEQVDPSDEFLLSEIRTASSELDRLAPMVDNLIEAAWGCEGALARVLALRDRLAVPALSSSAIQEQLGRLVAGLAGIDERARDGFSPMAVDPASGSGDLLIALAVVLGEERTLRVCAAEPDPYLARLARRRLLVHGVDPHDLDLRITSEWDTETESPDVVVTQLPYRAQEKRSAHEVLTMLDEVGLRLSPGSTAVVLGPADVLVGALSPYSVDERARADLLRSGMVEAVVRLPGGLIPFRVGYETAIWVLTSPHSMRSESLRRRVLLADVSDRALTNEVVGGLIEDVVTWRREGYRPEAHTRRFCAQVTVDHLLDPPRALTGRLAPSIREVRTEVPETVARMRELEVMLERLVAPAHTERPSVYTAGVATGSAQQPQTARIGALAKSNRLVVVKGNKVAETDVTDDGHHAVLGPTEVAGSAPTTGRSIDRGVLAEQYPRVVLTEPGDVLVTTTPELAVRIDWQGYSVVQTPVRALRIPDDEREQFTPRVLAALLTSGSHGRRAAGTVRPGRLDDWEIPLLDTTTVTRLDAALERIERRRQLAEQEIGTLDELHRMTMTGLADGTLTLQPEAGH